jgi:predicted flap endonuclease-1-like 5' DNA nuclease
MFEQQVTLGPGTGTFTQHTLEILIMLLGAFLLGVWLGWMLWNKYKQEADKLRIDVQSMTATVNALNGEMSSVKTKLSASEANNLSLRAQVDKLTEDNRIFRDQLSETSDDLAETEHRNRQLETELGLSFAPPSATPETIPLEINMTPEPPAPPVDAAPVVVVVETTTTTTEIIMEVTETPAPAPVVDIPAEEIKTEAETPAPVAEKPEEPVVAPAAAIVAPVAETPPVVVAAAAGDEKDDLTVIEGIGPKIQELLYQYGVHTYKQLAETEVTRLKEILAAAGPQLAMHDPGTWSAQANLAANDKWEDLKAYQGFLKGGKTPVNPPG